MRHKCAIYRKPHSCCLVIISILNYKNPKKLCDGGKKELPKTTWENSIHHSAWTQTGSGRSPDQAWPRAIKVPKTSAGENHSPNLTQSVSLSEMVGLRGEKAHRHFANLPCPHFGGLLFIWEFSNNCVINSQVPGDLFLLWTYSIVLNIQ